MQFKQKCGKFLDELEIEGFQESSDLQISLANQVEQISMQFSRISHRCQRGWSNVGIRQRAGAIVHQKPQGAVHERSADSPGGFWTTKTSRQLAPNFQSRSSSPLTLHSARSRFYHPLLFYIYQPFTSLECHEPCRNLPS